VNSRRRIVAVGVVVPARDEQERIGACLRSVRVAIDKLPRGITTAVTVVLDRCSDRTPALVDELVRHWPAATAVSIAATGVRQVLHPHGHCLSSMPSSITGGVVAAGAPMRRCNSGTPWPVRVWAPSATWAFG
jgi:hypothetical protein